MFGITFTWKIAKVNEVYLHIVPEIFLLLLDLLLPSWCGLSHFFVAGVAYKVKQTMLLLLQKFQSRGFLCVSRFYLFLYVLWPSELHTVHHESLSLVLHICI